MRHSWMRGGRFAFVAWMLASCAKPQADVEAPLPAPGYVGGGTTPAPPTTRSASPSPAEPAPRRDAAAPSDTPSGGAAEIYVGMSQAVVRTTTGDIWMWNTHGTNYIPSQRPMPARAVALDHCDGELVVLEDGTVASLRGTILPAVPTPAGQDPRIAHRVANLANVRAVCTHDERSFFLRRDGTVFVIAAKGYVPKTNHRVFETEELPSLTGAEEIVGGGDTTCARLRGGDVRCWATNIEKPDGAKLRMLPAFKFPPGASLDREFVVLADKTVRGWGRNDHAQLGDGTQVDRAAPVVIKGLEGVVQIARGPYSSCALHDGGKLSCWGDGTEFPMIPNQLVALHPKPVPITFASSTPPIAEVRVGITSACARLTDGRVMCWGDNWDGQIGDGEFGGEREPTFVKGFGGPAPVPMPANPALRAKARPAK